jgi:bidirectional [NiFe] hydrogenase diaphorase subunit
LPQKKVSLRIDGELVNALEGRSILEAARAAGKNIPTLCYLEGMSSVGACRLCMVEVSGIDHVCAVCVANGHCELQDTAYSLGVTSVRFAYNFPKLRVDATHPRYVLDHNRCILCTRCVRVCAEIEGAHVWDVVSRGTHARIASDLNQNWGDAKSCTNCGKCVQVCPTGALAEKGKAVEEMVRAMKPINTVARRRGGVHA